MANLYENPTTHGGGSIGATQLNPHAFERKALIEARKEAYFGQLASVKSMPKNSGKHIKLYHIIPLLDDQNLNDQGIDAAGVVIATDRYTVKVPLVGTYATGALATTAAAAINAVQAGVATAQTTTAPYTVTSTKEILNPATQAQANAIVAAVPGSTSKVQSGNLYGSSKDVGLISGKLPVLSETGGRVNRVGFTRKELSGTFEKFGFFTEYTQELLDFDSDAELLTHINRELLNAAMEITEDCLQADLINNAGTVRYAGSATDIDEIAHGMDLTYLDLMRLSIELDKNRTPKKTTMITGTRMIDTVTLDAARVLYVGSEAIPSLEAMTDLHGNPAWVPARKYAAGTTLLNGERGAVNEFRVVIVPEMEKFEGAGAVATNAAYHATNGRYDVFPALVVGDESFTTIGFQTDGKTVKFTINHKKPSDNIDRNDPYGEVGFISIKWYYGFLALRPERIALYYFPAKL